MCDCPTQADTDKINKRWDAMRPLEPDSCWARFYPLALASPARLHLLAPQFNKIIPARTAPPHFPAL
jgi:hypothetical protein